MKELERVLATYAKHITRIYIRVDAKQRPLTDAERRGIDFYREVGSAIQSLINR